MGNRFQGNKFNNEVFNTVEQHCNFVQLDNKSIFMSLFWGCLRKPRNQRPNRRTKSWRGSVSWKIKRHKNLKFNSLVWWVFVLRLNDGLICVTSAIFWTSFEADSAFRKLVETLKQNPTKSERRVNFFRTDRCLNYCKTHVPACCGFISKWKTVWRRRWKRLVQTVTHILTNILEDE